MPDTPRRPRSHSSVWNWIAATLAALITALFAFDVADVDRRWMTATAVTAIVLLIQRTP